jgi:hypothetical protein
MTPVPELAAKKAKREEAWATQKAADALEARKKAKETRRVIFKKAAAYVEEFRQQVWIGKRQHQSAAGRKESRRLWHLPAKRALRYIAPAV